MFPGWTCGLYVLPSCPRRLWNLTFDNRSWFGPFSFRRAPFHRSVSCRGQEGSIFAIVRDEMFLWPVDRRVVSSLMLLRNETVNARCCYALRHPGTCQQTHTHTQRRHPLSWACSMVRILAMVVVAAAYESVLHMLCYFRMSRSS